MQWADNTFSGVYNFFPYVLVYLPIFIIYAILFLFKNNFSAQTYGSFHTNLSRSIGSLINCIFLLFL